MSATLEKLSNVCGVTGSEAPVRELLSQLLRPYVDELIVDRLENVIAIKKGKQGKPKIMLAAHMDEVGLMVKTITKDGFLQFSKIGGIDDRILPAQKVVVHTKNGVYSGIIGSKPPHVQKVEERSKVLVFDDLFIDVGAESRADAEKMGVSIGNSVSFDTKYVALNNNLVMGKAFDNRAGCLAMVETLKLLGETDCTVYAVGTVQEEVGLRGAGTAAFGVDPDIALALDVTVAGDVPGVREYDTSVKTGKGPVLTVSDSGLITHPKILRWLLDTAEEEKIAVQLESGLMGSTDAAKISLTRQGIPSGTISVPTRYIHSPAAVLNMQDIANSAKLAKVAIQKISNHF
ncbi:MAG: M42 family metallopeptidase [Nitrososphaerota archaeon]|nr:M42 family metallopeptidase [Candidatus Termiticorpusculum sp.]MCL2257979.1 M42 family metallopeptidase [Candidatus Termiticorpusculum sp.]MCL2291839.1 M42 family metallopeptidase [Candidatus Termiticorpusculum sp.]MDR0459930.1 M42 family metallopeptidase [Nitrososphaerota archaeon]